MLGARLAVGDHEGDGADHGLLVDARPVEGLGVLEDDDRRALDGRALRVRDGEAVGHARLAHVFASHEGAEQGIRIVGDAELGGFLGNEGKGLLTRTRVLAKKNAVGGDDLAHVVFLSVDGYSQVSIVANALFRGPAMQTLITCKPKRRQGDGSSCRIDTRRPGLAS